MEPVRGGVSGLMTKGRTRKGEKPRRLAWMDGVVSAKWEEEQACCARCSPSSVLEGQLCSKQPMGPPH